MSGNRFPMHRVNRGPKGVAFTETPPPAEGPVCRPRVLRAARMLAVAHALEEMLARGDVRGRGELAAALRMSEARLSQLIDLTLLAPDIQEELVFLEVTPGRDPIPERALRHVVRARAWSEQRRRWRALHARGGRGSRSRPWAAPNARQGARIAT